MLTTEEEETPSGGTEAIGKGDETASAIASSRLTTLGRFEHISRASDPFVIEAAGIAKREMFKSTKWVMRRLP